jgi:hypothetical protein
MSNCPHDYHLHLDVFPNPQTFVFRRIIVGGEPAAAIYALLCIKTAKLNGSEPHDALSLQNVTA